MKSGKGHEVYSKRKLQNLVASSFQTAIIGALVACEENLGYLWGHDIDEDELTEEELEMKRVWEKIRCRILDNGNKQKRIVLDELQRYRIDWKMYNTNFLMKGK